MQALLELLGPLGCPVLKISAVLGSGFETPCYSLGSLTWVPPYIKNNSFEYCKPINNQFIPIINQIQTSQKRIQKYFCTGIPLPLRNVRKHLKDRPGYYQKRNSVLPAMPNMCMNNECILPPPRPLTSFRRSSAQLCHTHQLIVIIVF